jgi:hypothetical protein
MFAGTWPFGMEKTGWHIHRCARAVLGGAAAGCGCREYFPLQSYRVGPYAAGGSFFGGFIDYMQLINARDGGVNGVKLVWKECETEYVVEKGVECYERLKKAAHGAPALPPIRCRSVSRMRRSTVPRPTRFRSSRSTTAAPIRPTGPCFPTCSLCS